MGYLRAVYRRALTNTHVVYFDSWILNGRAMSGSRPTTALTPLRLRKGVDPAHPAAPYFSVALPSHHELFLAQYLASVAGICIFMHNFADGTEHAGTGERAGRGKWQEVESRRLTNVGHLRLAGRYRVRVCASPSQSPSSLTDYKVAPRRLPSPSAWPVLPPGVRTTLDYSPQQRLTSRRQFAVLSLEPGPLHTPAALSRARRLPSFTRSDTDGTSTKRGRHRHGHSRARSGGWNRSRCNRSARI